MQKVQEITFEIDLHGEVRVKYQRHKAAFSPINESFSIYKQKVYST